MSELAELGLADYAAMLKQAQAGIAALSAARDARYAEEVQDFVDTFLTEVPMEETPTSAYAGHRHSFKITSGGREYLCAIDLRDVKRSAERKAEQAKAKAAADAKEKADTPA